MSINKINHLYIPSEMINLLCNIPECLKKTKTFQKLKKLSR